MIIVYKCLWEQKIEQIKDASCIAIASSNEIRQRRLCIFTDGMALIRKKSRSRTTSRVETSTYNFLPYFCSSAASMAVGIDLQEALHGGMHAVVLEAGESGAKDKCFLAVCATRWGWMRYQSYRQRSLAPRIIRRTQLTNQSKHQSNPKNQIHQRRVFRPCWWVSHSFINEAIWNSALLWVDVFIPDRPSDSCCHVCFFSQVNTCVSLSSSPCTIWML